MAQTTVSVPESSSSPAPVPEPARGRGFSITRFLVDRREATIFLVAVVLVIYFGIRAGSTLWSSSNLSAIFGYAAPWAAIAMAMVPLLVLGEIDLSAGAMFLAAPWIIYFFWSDGLPVGLAMVLSLLVCCGIGIVNGLFTVLAGVPSFVTTVAMNYILYGIVLIYSGDTGVSMPGAAPPQTGLGAPPQAGLFGQIFGSWQWSEVLWVAAIALVLQFVLVRTRFGVHVTASGGNIVGAAEAGVPVRRVKMSCFAICSLVAGFVGILDAIGYSSIAPGTDGTTYILYAVAAAVIGGTALSGGRGTVIGAFIGAFVLAILYNGLNLINVNVNVFYVVVGIVILVVTAADAQLRRFVIRLSAK
jgi:simple sugar transport system permease protein